PRAAGPEMVFSQIRLVADAVFYLLQWRLCHSPQLRDLSPPPSRLAPLQSTAPPKRRPPIFARPKPHSPDQHPRYRASADALRWKMAMAILTRSVVRVVFQRNPAVRGRTILISVNSPGCVSTSMEPPCCFTTMS